MSNLSFTEMSSVFHLPQAAAAKALGVGLTPLKRGCKKLGIIRWPYRKLLAIDTKLAELQGRKKRASDANEISSIEIDIIYLSKQKEAIYLPSKYTAMKSTKKFNMTKSVNYSKGTNRIITANKEKAIYERDEQANQLYQPQTASIYHDTNGSLDVADNTLSTPSSPSSQSPTHKPTTSNSLYQNSEPHYAFQPLPQDANKAKSNDSNHLITANFSSSLTIPKSSTKGEATHITSSTSNNHMNQTNSMSFDFNEVGKLKHPHPLNTNFQNSSSAVNSPPNTSSLYSSNQTQFSHQTQQQDDAFFERVKSELPSVFFAVPIDCSLEPSLV